MNDLTLSRTERRFFTLRKAAFAVIAGLMIAACSSDTRKKIDDDIEEHYQQICEFDNITFQKVKRGTPGHQLCVELWRSGIDPDEIYNDNGGGQSD